MAFLESTRRLFRRPRETALCMNSSYFGFFAHAGFLKGLLELGIRPDHVSGASAGALVAGIFAAGHNPEEMLAGFLDGDFAAVFKEWEAPFRLAGALTNRPGYTGALSGRKALPRLTALLGNRRIEECLSPTLSLSVANLTRGRSQIVTRGPLAEYVLASCAMPGLLQCRRINGDLFMDGGVADPAPFEHWLDNERIRRIIVHLVTAEHNGHDRNSSFSLLGALNRSHDIITDELLRLKLKLAEKSGKEIFVVRTNTPRLGPRKTNQGRYNAELGRRSAARLPVR